MKVIKKSNRIKPKLSLILLDWGVRESFHLLHYLSKQTINRDLFEIIIVEYYSNISDVIKPFEKEVDTWMLLEMPESAYYHKHLMYNAGLVMSTGEIIIICDSDAMAKPTFLESILTEFEKDPNIVLHIDQFRNNRREFYPFNYPSFDEVSGKGCINYVDGLTTGLAATEDLIHNRNYGACFCARREDLIKIGGADEHIDFIGHICGPYDFTFRLKNLNLNEIWHKSEFLYHTWHPGQAGDNNYLGPHDGRHMSTTSLEAISSMRTEPHVMNLVIEKIRNNSTITEHDLQNNLILDDYKKITSRQFLESKASQEWAIKTYKYITYSGLKIFAKENIYYALPTFNCNEETHKNITSNYLFKANSLDELKTIIDKSSHIRMGIILRITAIHTILSRFKQIIYKKLHPYYLKVRNKLKTLKAPFNKYKQAKIEHQYFWSGIKSMIINIQTANKAGKKPTVILNNNNEIRCLKIAMKFKLISKIKILQFSSADEIKRFLLNKNEMQINKNDPFFLSQKTYIEHMLNHSDLSIKNDLFII